MTSAAMAEYDLTQRMVPYLDRHLVLSLLDFLQERKVHPDQTILLRKMELLPKTNMVDYSWSVYKALFNSKEVPNYILEKKTEVDAMLKALEGWVAPMTRFLQNAHSLKHLTGDRDYNLTMLHHCYKIGPDQIHALYEYGVFQFECGNYSVVRKYFDNYIPLSTKKELQFSALWGKLAAAILMKNWNTALVDFYRLKKIIDLEHLFESLTDVVQTKVGLVHWSLFVFFNHEDGIAHVIDLFNQDKYFNVIQTMAPYLLRYFAAAVIMSMSKKPQFGNFINIVQSGQCYYKDPIIELFTCLYVNDKFDGAQSKVEKCVEVMLNDPFLGKRVGDGSYSLIDEFKLSAFCFIMESSRKRQVMDKSALAMRLNPTGKDAERCIAIQNYKLDVGIDLSKEVAFTNPNHSNMFISNQLINNTPPMTIKEPSFHAIACPNSFFPVIDIENQGSIINNTPPMTIEEPSFDAIASANSFFPAIDNENQVSMPSIFQPFPSLDSQPMASPLSSQAIGYSPFASSYLSGAGLHQNNILHCGPSGITKVVDDYSGEHGLKMKESKEMTHSFEQVISDDVNNRNQRKEPIPDNDVEKHCSCEETQCLKLCCECFCARLSCGETCACRECLNRTEYEEIVVRLRAMMETKNPTTNTSQLS